MSRPRPEDVYRAEWTPLPVDQISLDVTNWDEMFVWTARPGDFQKRVLSCHWAKGHRPIVLVRDGDGKTKQAWRVEI